MSENDYDWLGDGIYFFQDAPIRAFEWAEEICRQRGGTPSVLKAEVRLRDCIDLLDVAWYRVLSDAFHAYIEDCALANISVPIQKGKAHRLDRNVVNTAVGLLSEDHLIVRCVRAAFVEGEPVYPGSRFCNKSHVQIAIRDTSCILRVEEAK